MSGADFEYPNGLRANRRGTTGRIFRFSLDLPTNEPNFRGGTARVEIFVRDDQTYKPITFEDPFYFSGIHTINGKSIPGRAVCSKKKLVFYPPILPGQIIPLEHRLRAEVATENVNSRIYWPKGPPTTADLKVETRYPVPDIHIPMDMNQSDEHKMITRKNHTMRFVPFNDRLPEKEVVNGRWGYRFDINFPTFNIEMGGKELKVSSPRLRDYFVPFNPEYNFLLLQPSATKGVARNGDWVNLPNMRYRYWPPSFPGQHVKQDYQSRVSKANMDEEDRFEFLSDPLPVHKNVIVPRVENREPEDGGHGYTYNNIRYPPVRVELRKNKVVDGKELRTQN